MRQGGSRGIGKTRGPYSTRSQRYEYAIDNPLMFKRSHFENVERLRAAGLISPTTYHSDVSCGACGACVRDLRGKGILP